VSGDQHESLDLDSQVPDLGARTTFGCGPNDLLHAVILRRRPDVACVVGMQPRSQLVAV
jgi:hypothetical protein